MFDSRQLQAHYTLNQITLSHCIDFYHTHLLNPTTRRQITCVADKGISALPSESRANDKPGSEDDDEKNSDEEAGSDDMNAQNTVNTVEQRAAEIPGISVTSVEATNPSLSSASSSLSRDVAEDNSELVKCPHGPAHGHVSATMSASTLDTETKTETKTETSEMSTEEVNTPVVPMAVPRNTPIAPPNTLNRISLGNRDEVIRYQRTLPMFPCRLTTEEWHQYRLDSKINTSDI